MSESSHYTVAPLHCSATLINLKTKCSNHSGCSCLLALYACI